MSAVTTGFELKDITFGYEKEQHLINKLSLNLPKERVTLLTGANGAGKTTLAKLLAGIITAQEGSVLWSGKHVQSLPKAELFLEISLLYQQSERNLCALNAGEDLAIWLMGMGLSKTESKAKISTALHVWELDRIRQRPLWELSAGEQKRVCLAGIGLFPERYWILDEPTAGLDEQHAEILAETVRIKQAKGCGAFIITHNAKLFESCADTIWHLDEHSISERAIL